MRAMMLARRAAMSDKAFMRSRQVLASVAARLNLEAGAPPIPALYFFTDPERVPDPVSIAARLPPGAAVVYRHFGANNRFGMAQKLGRLCRRRGLKFLIAADPELAAQAGADGVHWPERRAPAQRQTGGLVTVAAHSASGVARAQAMGADACILSPVFPTQSGSGKRPLGLFRASQIARASSIRIVALGGVNAKTAPLLMARGFAGIAAIDALVFD